MAEAGSAPKDQIAAFRSDGITASTGLRLQFFTESFSRAYGFPETRLRNLISEATPLREERPYTPLVGLREVHYSRPGLVTGLNPGSGPIRCLFQAPPALGGFMAVVSGQTAYRLDTGASIGAVGGTDMVRFAVSRTQIVLAAAGVPYLFDSTTSGAFSAMTGTILPPVLDVAYLGDRFVYALIGSDTFYWSEINDAANVGGLNFATAEEYPDPITALSILNEELLIFGTQSVETWSIGSSADAPFTPVEGKGYQRGCVSRDAACYSDNSIYWIGENRVVYKTTNVPQRISSPSIEDKLRECSNIGGCTAFVATFEGHELYVLNIPGVGTYVYDDSRLPAASGIAAQNNRSEWSEWTSFGRGQFRGRCSLSVNGTVYVGDDTTNDVWTMQLGVYQDGSTPLVRIASAFIKVESGLPRCDNLVLHAVVGVGNTMAVNPTVEMRYSDDQGKTFKDWRPASLGAQGAYGTVAYWQRLGMMRAPGRLVEIRVSDPVNVALSHLTFNEPRPAQ